MEFDGREEIEQDYTFLVAANPGVFVCLFVCVAANPRVFVCLFVFVAANPRVFVQFLCNHTVVQTLHKMICKVVSRLNVGKNLTLESAFLAFPSYSTFIVNFPIPSLTITLFTITEQQQHHHLKHIPCLEAARHEIALKVK